MCLGSCWQQPVCLRPPSSERLIELVALVGYGCMLSLAVNTFEPDPFPDDMACPGFLSSVRYEEVDADGRYMAIYDLAGTSAWETPEYFKARGFEDMEPYVTDVSILAYRPIFRWVQDR